MNIIKDGLLLTPKQTVRKLHVRICTVERKLFAVEKLLYTPVNVNDFVCL